jgi:hypothetical protein
MLRSLWSNKIHDVNGTSPCVEAWSRSFFGIFYRPFEALGSRSSKWRALRIDHLKKNPACAVCGNTKKVVPHHIVPYHIDPSKELDPLNLISLCEGDTFNCHLFFGHLRNWSRCNPDIVEDARLWREKISGITDGDLPLGNEETPLPDGIHPHSPC